jgi:hypothetical protein
MDLAEKKKTSWSSIIISLYLMPIDALDFTDDIPQSFPAPYETQESTSSNATILNDDNGVEPG